MKDRPIFFILTELNVLYLLLRVLRKQPVCIIETRSLLLGRTSVILQKLVDFLHFRGHVQDLEKDRGELIQYPFFGDLIRSTNVFAECEPWLESRMQFSNTADELGPYSTAYRHSCSNAAFNRYRTAYLIYGILNAHARAKISGMDRFDVDFFNYRFRPVKITPHRISVPAIFSNLFLLLLSAFYTIFSIVIRIRPFYRQETSYRLGSDFIYHKTNYYLWDEVSDSNSDILVVFRNRADQKQYRNQIDGRPFALATDGRFSLLDGTVAVGQAIFDFNALLWYAGGLPSDFFRRLVGLPFNRIMYRALFNRFRFEYFWSKDDYNPEHSLRTVELRRKNSVSMGIMHGIPSVASIIHQFRHIDFDIYYVAGRYQAETYYKKYWPSKMKVTPIGSFGVSRDRYLELMNRDPNQNGIACYLSPHFLHREILQSLVKVALAFPSRTLYINTKYKPTKPQTKSVQSEFDADILEFVENSPSNIEFYAGSSYDLFLKCDTVLSPGSTLNAEAIQFGLNSFVFDYAPKQWKAMDYRNFPGACVHSSAELISRLKDIENGIWRFPREKWSRFIDMSGSVPWDIIRQDMGLSRRTDHPIQNSSFHSDVASIANNRR